MSRAVRRLGWAAVAAMMAAPAADAQDSDPDWLRKPSREQLLAVFPADALRRAVRGKAVIHCKVAVQGTLRDCHPISESPAGAGFGAAAVALTPQFLMKPAMRDGKPVADAEIRIPITFIPPVGSTPENAAVGAQRVLGGVTWSQAPTFAEVAAAYPAKARAANAGGSVLLNCMMSGDGGLRRCDVASETPRGLGLGEAARTLAPRFVGPTKTAEGRPTVGAMVQVLITFDPQMLTARPPLIGKPKWTVLPSAEALAAAVPPEAQAAGITSARVMVNCGVGAEGRLQDCKVLSEQPSGFAFGPATQRLAETAQVTVWTDEGLPTVGGCLNAPIRFNIAPPPAKAP